jgi:hypothetical protein
MAAVTLKSRTTQRQNADFTARLRRNIQKLKANRQPLIAESYLSSS